MTGMLWRSKQKLKFLTEHKHHRFIEREHRTKRWTVEMALWVKALRDIHQRRLFGHGVKPIGSLYSPARDDTECSGSQCSSEPSSG